MGNYKNSTVLCNKPQKTVVGAGGLEPPTNGLKGRCSTIELHSQLIWQTEKFIFRYPLSQTNGKVTHLTCQWQDFGNQISRKYVRDLQAAEVGYPAY